MSLHVCPQGTSFEPQRGELYCVGTLAWVMRYSSLSRRFFDEIKTNSALPKRVFRRSTARRAEAQRRFPGDKHARTCRDRVRLMARRLARGRSSDLSSSDKN